MPKFKPWRFRSKQHPYPELQSKAYNARCVVGWLCEEMISIAKSDQYREDHWVGLASCCVWHLAEWHRKSELMPRYLTPDQSMELQRLGQLQLLISTYLALRIHPNCETYNAALTAAATGELWQLALHYFQVMEDSPSMSPDERSYTLAINACRSQPEHARRLFDCLNHQGLVETLRYA
ncbi:Hypothetical protein SCF082_LOCUS4494 [Durusdinium trenchii]|uniref:Uncharacterized protein n=1 Tax=Durusdinium trenchii TaxID=1381693 RepID=A0ABP0I374_9DINO